jgi:hypothetical protein
MPISTPSLASTSFSAHERESGIVSTKVAHEHSSHLQLLAQCQQEAAQRMAGRQKLKDEYANLLTQEEKRRDKLASDLVSTDLGDLFLSPACPSENDSEDTHVVSLEIAQSLFRQLAIDHLRKHYHTIKASYLIQFNSTAAQDRQEIISLISDQLIYSILPAIPDELRDFLSKEAIHDQNYRQKTGLAYFKVGQIYPTATGQITISSPEDFDRVYGDLLAVLSGIGLSKWEASQEKQQRVQTQLTQYKCTNPALRTAHGTLLQENRRTQGRRKNPEYLQKKDHHHHREGVYQGKPGIRGSVFWFQACLELEIYELLARIRP